jgi:hypothetical protein
MPNGTKKSKATEPERPAGPSGQSSGLPASASGAVPTIDLSIPDQPLARQSFAPSTRPSGLGTVIDQPPAFGLDQSGPARSPAQPTRPFGLPTDSSQSRGARFDEPTQSSGSTFTGANQEHHTQLSDIYEQEPRHPRETVHVDTNELQRTRQKLDSFVEQFRSDQISKSKALVKIAELIDDSPVLSESEKSKTLRLFYEELESSSRDDAEPEFLTQLRDKRSSGVNLAFRPSSRASRSDDGSQNAESIDLDERPSKKKKLSHADLGWAEDDGESPMGPLPLSCRKTLKRLDEYAQDISRCKFLVRSVRRAPTGIPDSQWERIFKGQALDLDHFLSSLHRTSIDEEGETRIGNAKISFGVSDAKRRVSTYGEWVSAWNLASSAIAFAFPHRAEELRVYGEFIGGEFGAKLPHSHPRVIMFDIAVRNQVQGGQSFLLNDHHLFLRFHSAILMPDGVELSSRKASSRRLTSTPGRASGNKPDICNRFNTLSGCPSSDFNCRYRHVCKICKKSGHGKEQHEN